MRRVSAGLGLVEFMKNLLKAQQAQAWDD